MAYHCSHGTFGSLEEMMADYRSRMTLWDHVVSATWYPARRRIGNARRAVRYAYQRVARGYDDRSVWNLGFYLPKYLGEQLVTMAESAHGYPDDYGHTHRIPDDPSDNPHFTQWTTDLRRHGEALLAFDRHRDDLDELGGEWGRVYSPAQEALRWVADNLASLWD